MKPNIFSIATKELSQDGFFTWLLQWSDPSNSKFDKNLNKIAQNFVLQLIQKQFPTDNFIIEKITAGRQWKNIDIWAEINENYAVIIEDKTFSGEHSKQLERYKEIAQNHYNQKKYKLVFIYLKTGNESLSTLNEIKEKQFQIFDRQNILTILNSHKTENQILTEFKEYVQDIENQTNSYNSLNNILTNWFAAEGFYMKIQENIDEWTDWRYVPNQSGGFLGFWYNWQNSNYGNLYIQIENSFENGIKLVIKIDSWEQKTQLLYEILGKLKEIALKYDLSVVKPNKYRAGATSTIAIINNIFPTEKNGKFEITNFVKKLKNIENLIQTFCNQNK